jgi:hypothetical protein
MPMLGNLRQMMMARRAPGMKPGMPGMMRGLGDADETTTAGDARSGWAAGSMALAAGWASMARRRRSPFLPSRLFPHRDVRRSGNDACLGESSVRTGALACWRMSDSPTKWCPLVLYDGAKPGIVDPFRSLTRAAPAVRRVGAG